LGGELEHFVPLDKPEKKAYILFHGSGRTTKFSLAVYLGLIALMTFIRYFFYIVAGALASSVIGGLFAAIVAVISPDFVSGLFSPKAGANLPRYAAAVGMIWGVFLGTSAMGFSLLLVTAVQVTKLLKKKPDEKLDV
jgi:hypothetical protein